MENKKIIQQIASDYEERDTSKFDELKKLDNKAKMPANIFAYTFGIISTLVLGTGMCLAMKVIGDLMVLGIIVGIIGIAMCTLTYPIYKRILKKGKEKYGAQIKELSNELLNA